MGRGHRGIRARIEARITRGLILLQPNLLYRDRDVVTVFEIVFPYIQMRNMHQRISRQESAVSECMYMSIRGGSI